MNPDCTDYIKKSVFICEICVPFLFTIGQLRNNYSVPK